MIRTVRFSLVAITVLMAMLLVSCASTDNTTDNPGDTPYIAGGSLHDTVLAIPRETATRDVVPLATGARESATFTPAATSTATPSPSCTPTTLAPTATSTQVPAGSPPTRIVIPKIGVDAKVVEVGWKVTERNGELFSEWEVADYAAGFHRMSAYPGRVGNTVISGHHNVKGEVFRDVYLLEPGDKIELYVGDEAYSYVVSANYRLLEAGVSAEQQRENAKWIQRTSDERLTLVTCWPYTGISHRIVVVALPE